MLPHIVEHVAASLPGDGPPLRTCHWLEFTEGRLVVAQGCVGIDQFLQLPLHAQQWTAASQPVMCQATGGLAILVVGHRERLDEVRLCMTLEEVFDIPGRLHRQRASAKQYHASETRIMPHGR